MSKGELQYIHDTFLVNEFARLYQDDFVKQAGVLDTLANAVNTYVISRIDTSSPGALAKSVVDLLAPAAFFRINPLFGILYTIGQSMFGLSLTGVLTSITNKIVPIITSGEKVDPSVINDAGKAMITTASDDLLAGLDRINKQAQLFGPSYNRTQPVGGSFIPPKNAPALQKIFGFLGQAKGKSLLVGFVVWLVKTVLLSAGLLAVGGGAAKLLGFDKKPEQPEVQQSNVANFPGQQIPGNSTPPTHAPSSSLLGLQSSGRGQEYYTNDMNTMWIVPLNGQSPADLLTNWAIEIYPQLTGYEDIITNNPSFQRTVNIIEKNHKPGKDLIIPPGFSRRIDIVNQFVGNVWNDIKERIANA